MLASKTSHKRRRSSARGDASRASVSDSRVIVTVAGSVKGKERQIEHDEEEVDKWAWKRLEKMMVSHAINHCLQVIVPVVSESESKALINRLPPSSRAYLVKVPLCLFLDPIFILSHIKRGHLIALSKGRLDTDDCFCLDGTGVLHLSLNRDSYQTLGLVGQVLKQSRTSSGKSRDRLSGKYERWMVRIDLVAPSFVAGKPGYDRTLTRLKDWDQRRADLRSSWDVLFCWTDANSIGGAEMHFPSRHVFQDDITKIDIKPSMSITDDCWTPLVQDKWSRGWAIGSKTKKQMDWDMWYEELERFLEWNGLASMSAECIRTFARSDHLNSYQLDSTEMRSAATVVKIEYRGLLSSEFCSSVVREVKSYLQSKQGSSRKNKFAILSCSGFTNSPVAWKMDSLSTFNPTKSHQLDSSNSEVSEGEDDGIYDHDHDMQKQTGPKARKLRQKKRAKRGTISREQVGYQVRLPGSANVNGWNVILFGDDHDQEQNNTEYVCVENVGGCLKC